MRGLVEEAKRLIYRQHGVEIDDEVAEGLVDQSIEYSDLARHVINLDRDEYDSYDDYHMCQQYEREQFNERWDCEIAWLLQMLGPRAAKIAGYRGVWLSDEMGRSVAACMESREAEFRLYVEDEE